MRRRGGLPPEADRGYFRALALRKLGQTEKAQAALQSLLESANRAVSSGSQMPDSGASFEEHQAARARLAAAHYVAGLGYLGLNDSAKAKEEMQRALEASPDHARARFALRP